MTRNNTSTHVLLSRLNLSLLFPSILLVILGLATFYSLDTNLFRQQLLFLFISLFAYFVFLNIDYKVFGYFPKFLYFFMLSLLLVLFVIGIEAKGAVRWIDIFGLRIQFSETIKPFFIIFMAQYLSSTESRSFTTFLKAFLLLFPIFFLTLKQPDLGNAIIYFSVTCFMLLLSGFRIRYFLALILAIVTPFPLIFNFLHGYQKERLLSFIGSSQDTHGSSYNAIQALISIGSGGVTGKGFGQATQSILRFLPERHTDFIFASVSESLGFVGGVVLIAVYCFLLYRIYKISESISDRFSYLIVMGFYFLLITHIFFNIGMNLGLLPIVGITLPLVSYGGSSLLTNFIALGVLSSIAFENKREQSIEIR